MRGVPRGRSVTRPGAPCVGVRSLRAALALLPVASGHAAARAVATVLVLHLASAGAGVAEDVPAQDPPDTWGVGIRGTVLDAVTRAPLSDVRVEIEELDLFLRTDEDGVFVLEAVPPGSYTLSLSRLGYRPSEGRFRVMRPGEFVTTLTPRDAEEDGRTSMGRLVGTVLDEESERPLADVEVRLPSLRLGAVSGPDGRFRVEGVPPGDHPVEFRHLGYTSGADTVDVTGGLTTEAHVRLAVDPVALEPLRVTVERREFGLAATGFYERREEGWGDFIEREEIERRGPAKVSELLHGLPRVWTHPDPDFPYIQYVVLGAGRHGNMAGDRYCYPMVVRDGLMVHRGGSEPARLDQIVSPPEVSGMEIYGGIAGVPPEYRAADAGCGVILVWTRR